jgi:hypothetical protein
VRKLDLTSDAFFFTPGECMNITLEETTVVSWLGMFLLGIRNIIGRHINSSVGVE